MQQQNKNENKCYCGMYVDVFNNEFEITECVYCAERNKMDTMWFFGYLLGELDDLDHKIDEHLNAQENEKYLMQYE